MNWGTVGRDEILYFVLDGRRGDNRSCDGGKL